MEVERAALTQGRLRTTMGKLSHPMTANELAGIANCLFNRQLAAGEAGQYLARVEVALRPLYTLTLRFLNTGVTRKRHTEDGLDTVLSFCREHSVSWDISILRGDEIARGQYIQALEDRFPNFERARQDTEQKLHGLLGYDLKIEVSEEGVWGVGPDLFDHWIDFFQKAHIGKGKIRFIVLSLWDSEQFTTPVHGRSVEIMDSGGGHIRKEKLILINSMAGLPVRFIAFHEFSHDMISRFAPLMIFAGPQEEYMVDFIAHAILSELKSPEAEDYQRTMLARHHLDDDTKREVEAQAKGILLKMNISHYSTKIGESPELLLVEDLLPAVALRDMPPQNRPTGYFKEGDLVVLVGRNFDRLALAPSQEGIKAVVKSVDRDEHITVEVVSDDGVLQNQITSVERGSNKVYEWDQGVAIFIPKGRKLREKEYISRLHLPEWIDSILFRELSISTIEELEMIPDELFISVPRFNATTIAQIRNAIARYRGRA